MHSARLLTLFPADIAVFTGSAAQPRTPVCKTFGCFNDASTWTPSGLAGAAGMRSYRKWRYVLESSFTPLSDADNRFLQLPPPRLAFLVCVRIACHCRDTSWGCGARPEPSWRACRVGKCSPSHALSEPPRRPGQLGSGEPHAQLSRRTLPARSAAAKRTRSESDGIQYLAMPRVDINGI